MIRAAIAGASGYAGGELLRLLLAHPQVEVTQITSETYAKQYAHFVHPNLRGHTDLRFSRLADLPPCDLLFLALPHGHAMDQIEDLAQKAGRIIDLSADFRLREPAAYLRWYGRDPCSGRHAVNTAIAHYQAHHVLAWRIRNKAGCDGCGIVDNSAASCRDRHKTPQIHQRIVIRV